MVNKQKRQLRICWVSNATWSPSGYSNVSADMQRKFAEGGWTGNNFAFIDMYGLGGGVIKADEFGFPHFPLMNHQFGSDAMVHHGNHFKADVLFTLLDLWPQNAFDLQQIPRLIPWLPVDYDPIPKPILANCRFANRIIAMSKFGQKQLADNGFSSLYIPHGVDTKIFYPMDKAKRKAEIGMPPKTFIFGMVSANKDQIPRKSFQQVLEAFAKFVANYPESLLYIHTDPDFPGGFPIKQYAAFLNISHRVVFPESYKLKYTTSKQEMNLIYNTFDCLLSPSSSEGFGIPIIEAQACGVPVIVHDWTAMPELIRDGVTGYKVKTGYKIWFPIGSFMAWPDTADLYGKMRLVKDIDREKMGKKGKEWVDQSFSLDMLWEKSWLPFLEKLELEIYGKEVIMATSDEKSSPQKLL